MTKPKFTPDPPPYLKGMPIEKAFPLFVDWVIRQDYRKEDWWPKDYEDRVQALEKLSPYCIGQWTIADAASLSFEIETDFVAVYPEPQGHAWVDTAAISNCKFKDTNATYAAPLSNHVQKTDSHPCWDPTELQLWILVRFTDFDYADFGSDAGYFWRGNVSSPERKLTFLNDANASAIIAAGYELGYWSIYHNPSGDVDHRIVLDWGALQNASTNSTTHGTSQYDGSDPVPTANPYGCITEVSAGTGNLRTAISNANDGDILVLKSGTHVVDSVGGNGIIIKKNIRIYGETGDPDDVVITNDLDQLDWAATRALLLWYVSAASPVRSASQDLTTCVNTPGSYVQGSGFDPGIFHVTFDTSPTTVNGRICFNRWLWGYY